MTTGRRWCVELNQERHESHEKNAVRWFGGGLAVLGSVAIHFVDFVCFVDENWASVVC